MWMNPDPPEGHSDVGDVGSFNVITSHSLSCVVGAKPILFDLGMSGNLL